MKKQVLGLVLGTTMMGLTVTAVTTGCGNGGADTQVSGDSQAGASDQADGFTVTFYDSDGTTVLKTQSVKSGELPEEFVPEKEGSVFVGWFATPQMSHPFDFAQAVTGDVSAFAGFVSYQEDNREFAIVGSGTSPALLESDWGKVINDIHKLTKEDNAEENRYTITLDLNEGDEFQFAIDTSWHNQRGYGYLDTLEKDGVEYFANAGSLGEASTKRANIKCKKAGNYTLTLITYPAEDYYETENANYSEETKETYNINSYDKITWVYNGESQAGNGDVRTDYYIKGAKITGWEDVYDDTTKFAEADGVYTLEVTLEEGDEFLFTTMVTVGDTSSVGTEYVRYTNISESDSDSLSFVDKGEGMGANMVAKKGGTYLFTYDPQSGVLKVSMK